MASNRRYLNALAAAPLQGEGVALDALCRPRTNRGRRHARFNPLGENDLALFRTVLAGEHAIVGFRNSDITKRLYTRPPADPDERRRRCERTSRLMVKLRGHALIAKIPRARRYRVPGAHASVERDRDHHGVRVVDEPGSKEVADHGGTPADAHVLEGLVGSQPAVPHTDLRPQRPP